jgi:hypothetical protein
VFQEGDQRKQQAEASEDYAPVKICGLRTSDSLKPGTAHHHENVETNRLAVRQYMC